MTDQPAKRAPRKATPKAAPEETPAPPAIADPEVVPAAPAWARVMRDVGAIAKDDLNRTPGASFKFRGIDATMNAVGPALRTHGAAVLPVRVEILESERYATKGGTQMHGMVTRHDWLIVGPDGDVMTYPDGSPIFLQSLGQAADAGDKVASKASSVAYRTVLLQALTVPTGDRDPDADAHERAVPDPRQEQWDRIAGLAKYARQSPESIRKHYLEKMGHDIDGPDATVATLTEYGDRLEASFKEQAEKLAAQQAEAPTGPCVKCGVPTSSQTMRDGADVFEHRTCPAPETQDPPAAEPNEPPAAEPAPESVPAQPEAQTPTQGRDPRQKLWDDILTSAKKAKMSADAVRADFREWSRDSNNGQPLEIDGPFETTTPDLLTRYAHVLRKGERP